MPKFLILYRITERFTLHAVHQYIQNGMCRAEAGKCAARMRECERCHSMFTAPAAAAKKKNKYRINDLFQFRIRKDEIETKYLWMVRGMWTMVYGVRVSVSSCIRPCAVYSFIVVFAICPRRKSSSLNGEVRKSFSKNELMRDIRKTLTKTKAGKQVLRWLAQLVPLLLCRSTFVWITSHIIAQWFHLYMLDVAA